MAYDTATGTTILFGGLTGSTYFNDTWSWNGTTWTKLTPATSPPARRLASMAYDPALGEIVLFGGCTATGYLSDTWAWNGTTWALLSTPGGLTARDDAAMSYDQTAGNMVLFGGLTSTGTYLGDTWLYGGSGWTQATPVHYPGLRGGMGFAYDSTLGRNVLFGGEDSSNTYADQWMWDGADWRQGVALTSWGPTANAVFLTGAGNGQMMLQGGYDWAAPGYWQDTVLFRWHDAGTPKSNLITTHRLDDRSTFSINPYDENLRIAATDFSESGVGQDLNLTREFNTDTSTTFYGAAGWGWTFDNSIDTTLSGGYPDSSLMLFGLRGTTWESYFHYNGSAYVSPVGLNADLVSAGGGWTLTYHASGEKLTFSAAGQLTSDVDRNGNGVHYAYSGYQATTITDGHGRVYTLAYGTNGFLHTITAPDGARVVTYVQDASNNLSTVTDAASDLTTYSYPTREVDVQDPNANITKFVDSFDGVTITYPETAPNTASYFSTPPDLSVANAWEKTTVTDQNSHATFHQVAFNGDVVKTTDALGHSRSSTYSASNEVLTATDALGTGNQVTFNYDASNNPTALTIPSGATTTAQYSNGGGCSSTDSTHPYLAKCISDPQGNQGTFTYDGPGNLTSSNVPSAGVTLTYTYNPSTPTCGGKVGQQCSSQNGNSHTTNYHYNTSGDLTTITPPTPQGATTQTFDTAGRVSTVTDGRGQKTTYSYDGDDRITQVLTAGATSCVYTAGTCVSYIYDNNGNRTSQHDVTGLTSFGYDVMNRQTSKTPPATSPLSLTYDSVGNTLTYQDAGGTVTYAYNAADQLTSLAEPGGSCTGTITLCTTFVPNNNGQRTTTTYPGNTVMTATLDKSGRPTEIKTTHGATVFSDFKYTYNKLSTDTEVAQTRTDVKTGLVTTYSYDFLNELTSAVEKNGGTTTASWLYCYDLAGNRTGYSTTAGATCGAPSTTYTYNADNELTALNGSSTGWAYDANGNENAGKSAAPRTNETYTASNQLSSLTVGGLSGSATYAGLTNDERVATAGTTTYQYGELGLASQTSGGTTINFTRDPSGTLISERGLGASYYYLFDGLGSVVAIVNSAGTLVNAYSYDPYGNTRTSSGPLTNPWQYTGGYHDGSGLYHLNARYYDPNLGRFTQPDPAGQGPNLYAYAGDNPINNTDPTGRGFWDDLTNIASDIVGTIVGSAIGAACEIGTFGLGTFGCGILGAASGLLVTAAFDAYGNYVSQVFNNN